MYILLQCDLTFFINYNHLKTGTGSVKVVMLSSGISSAWTSNTEGAPLQLSISAGMCSDDSIVSVYGGTISKVNQ